MWVNVLPTIAFRILIRTFHLLLPEETDMTTQSIQRTEPADHTTDLQRNAYNAAFYELGLGWHWDERTFEGLQPLQCEVERVKSYMEQHHSHLLHAYDPAFLAGAIESTKLRCIELMLVSGSTMAGHADWAALHSRQIGH